MASITKSSSNGDVNLTEGSIFKKLVIFSLPFIATNVLQLLFNAADVAVLGVFIKDVDRADSAVAAVGSTGSFINLLVSLVVGLSVGTNVLLSRCVGENNQEGASRVVSSSMALCLISSLLFSSIGVIFARNFLILMNCDPEVLDMATKYLRIYFFGMPVIMIYNFASSILRAVGNTLKAFYFLVIGGVLNIGINIFSTVVLHTDVEGVAAATVISQAVSAALAVVSLLRGKGFSHLSIKRIRLHKQESLKILAIGLPTGIHGCVFSVSNMFVQTAVNALGKMHMAGYAISVQIDGIFYQVMNSIAIASLTCVSQNLGAKNLGRVKKTMGVTLLLVTAVGLVMGAVMGLFGKEICSIMSKDRDVIEIAYRRLLIVGVPFFLCGIMEVFANVMRGLGRSLGAMAISIFGNCAIRIIWIHTIYAAFPAFDVLLLAFPVTWVITLIIYTVYYFCVMNKIRRNFERQEENVSEENL